MRVRGAAYGVTSRCPLRGPDRARRSTSRRDPVRRAGFAAALVVPFDRVGPRGVRPGAVEHDQRALHGVDTQPRTLRSALVLRRPLLASAAADPAGVRAVPAARDA